MNPLQCPISLGKTVVANNTESYLICIFKPAGVYSSSLLKQSLPRKSRLGIGGLLHTLLPSHMDRECSSLTAQTNRIVPTVPVILTFLSFSYLNPSQIRSFHELRLTRVGERVCVLHLESPIFVCLPGKDKFLVRLMPTSTMTTNGEKSGSFGGGEINSDQQAEESGSSVSIAQTYRASCGR